MKRKQRNKQGEDEEEDDERTRRHQRKLKRSHSDYVTGGYTQGGYVASTIREYRDFISRYVANPNYTTASTSNLGSRLRSFFEKEQVADRKHAEQSLQVSIPHAHTGYRMRFVSGMTTIPPRRIRPLPWYPTTR